MNLYVDLDRLPQYSENVARGIGIEGGVISAARSARELKNTLTRLKNRCAAIERYSHSYLRIPSEAEWILDNRYIAEREARSVISDLKKARLLPLAAGKEKHPVIYEAALSFVRSGKFEVSAERLECFLEYFQNECILSEKELSLFIPMVKLTLISALTAEAGKVAEMFESKLTGGEKNIFYIEELTEKLKNRGEDIPEYSEKTQEARKLHEEMTAVMAAIFGSLRLLAALDASVPLENVNRVERTLQKDPAKIYSKMDQESRGLYRRELARLSERRLMSEYETAVRVQKLAEKGDGKGAHVGYYIFDKPLGEEKKQRHGAAYAGTIVLITLFISLLLAFLSGLYEAAFLLFLPVFEIVKNSTDFIVLKITRPTHLPRMELKDGIPKEGRTLCVVSALLSSKEAGVQQAKLLEEYRLANRAAGSELLFGILADFKESKTAKLDTDDEFLEASVKAVEELNHSYGGGFYLFTRNRHYSERDKRYVGWERKRGAILELLRLILGKESSLKVSAGSSLGLKGIKYLILLDSDTRLTVDAARELVGAMLHPLNAPVVDKKKRIVSSGYGILQPRIAVDLAAANRSDFTRIFAGQGGIDPYGNNSSDVYQDLFGQGSFTGKGIISAEAFYECLNERFPKNTVLSHDLIEGSYLRSGFIGDTELTDSFPYKVSSYFERMHRWIRGDWQVLYWLFKRVRNEAGEKEINPISAISKWKIFDNLRRSLTPPAIFIALCAALFFGGIGLWIAAAAALLALSSNLLLSSVESMSRPGGILKPKYKTGVIYGIASALMQTFIQLMLLPYNAWICLSAVFTALFRMFISRRNMLAWTTASDSEKRSGENLFFYYRRFLIVLPAGLLLMTFSSSPLAMALGLLWLFTPALAYSLSLEIKEFMPISKTDRAFLTRAAADIWRYFDRMLTPQRNFLPPDNWQEEPAIGTAERSSPTNIGLAMLSALAAFDLSVITKECALGFIENILSTVERLKKWQGHLYNWYDIKSLRPLEPGYISTVDSGNFAGCIIALIGGLKELGETGTVQRLETLLNNMSFLPLYDESRKLFYIGFDTAQNAPTKGWYDLMASEARQTSYIAIARGEIEKKHWRRLGRTLTTVDGRSGMASWTGTMFEYFMPNLLMPWYKNSLICESLELCLYAHKKRSFPWGISESSFYAFDPALNYKYKAHGVQGLALKRGMERETVISPYSSFLALPFDPASSIINLRAMRKLGMEGRFGYYEAADFTKSRTGAKHYEIVKCFMVHHLGMSLLSIDNALRSGIMQRRFMSDPSMASHAELLQEKGPVGQVISTHQETDVPEKPDRMPTEIWKKHLSGTDLLSPACALLSNGAYTVLMTELGMSRSCCENMRVTNFDSDRFSGNCGMSFFLKTGTDFVSLLPAPEYDAQTSFHSEFSGEYCRIYSKFKDIESCMEVFVPQSEIGEHRSMLIRNTASEIRDFELFCYFEPVLSHERDFKAHPAFSKLSLETSLYNDSIIVKRRRGSRAEPAVLSFACSEKMSYDTSKELSLGRGGLRAVTSLSEPGFTLGAVLDPCVLTRVRFSLRSNESIKVHYALAVSEDEDSAYMSASRILKMRKLRGLSNLDMKAKLYDMVPSETDAAMSRLCGLVFTTGERAKLAKQIEASCSGRQGLWRFGISGDYPVLSVIAENEDEAEKAVELIKEHALITQNGFQYDLILILNDGGSYHRPVFTLISDALRRLGCESGLNMPAGLHLVDGNASEISGVLSMSDVVIRLSEGIGEAIRNTEYKPDSAYLMKSAAKNKELYETGFDTDNSFVFKTNGGLCAPAWSHMLTNGNLGYIASDAGTGNMWYKNARELRINNWKNDPLGNMGTETVELYRGGKAISAFADCDGYPCTVTFGFGFAKWEKVIGRTRLVTTAFISPETDARVLLLELENAEEGDRIRYFTELVLGAEEEDKKGVVTTLTGGGFSAKTLMENGFGQHFTLLSSQEPKDFTCDRVSWRLGLCDRRIGAGLDACIGAYYNCAGKMTLVCGTDSFEKLSALVPPETAEKVLKETRQSWERLVKPTVIETPLKELDYYMNGWALYQVLACRIMGRSSMYQSGGAYGFRDQLQDVCALVVSAPEIAKRQILMACAHQYEQGDVQHWWHRGRHGEADKGVRTRCSDDLLWLVYTLCEYVEKTGDMSILDIETDYLRSPELRDGENDRYEMPEKASMPENVYAHCVRALELVINRGTGRHGLLFIGGGDWNDGFDKVGAEGKGESVWLTWFAAMVMKRFSKLSSSDFAAKLENERLKLSQSAEGAWDGGWYLRGFYDNGATLGSRLGAECQIDSIAQSFAAISALGSEKKTALALKNAVYHLFDRENKIVKLFTPAFDGKGGEPGYIIGYLPGVRENGGQYTHAAVWLACALLKSGMEREGADMLFSMLPFARSQEIYKTEPYVLAADVYANSQHMGRGGWSWYTGAAAWYYRVVMEELLGVSINKGKLKLSAKLPSGWRGFSVSCKTPEGLHHIKVDRGGKYRLIVSQRLEKAQSGAGDNTETVGFELVNIKASE